MGKRGNNKFKRNDRGDGDQKRARVDDRDANSVSQRTVNTVNEKFELFYRANGIVKDNAEWAAFHGALESPLPACFRVRAGYIFAPTLLEQLHSFVGNNLVLADGTTIEAVSTLPWCPNGFRLGIDRRGLRKSTDEKLEGLHEWLVKHTDAGNITRQEAVSMVPPLCLNLEPHHKVLDMCASPGSKTSQILEIIGQSQGCEVQGVVVANDKDTNRAYMLVHQCRRAAAAHLVVTTHGGQDFPLLNTSVLQTVGTAKDGIPLVRKSRAEPFFDRVLCDVPCSGDGTLRKNYTVWRSWRVHNGLSLHPLQLLIAKRGILVTKPGGLLVYSTCSMSPFEDESVVAELLRQNKGTLELVDGREFVKPFKARPGLSTWHVIDDNKLAPLQDGRIVRPGMEVEGEGEGEGEKKTVGYDHKEGETWLETAVNAGFIHFPNFESVPDHRKKNVMQSLFPPTAEEASWMHLERCLRCLPQDEDSGGFFVATFRKLPLPSSTSSSSSSAASSTTEAAVGNSNDDEDASPTEEQAAVAPTKKNQAVRYIKWDPELHQRVEEFYDLTGPLQKKEENLYVREDSTQKGSKDELHKTVYYLPPSLGTKGIIACGHCM